MKLTKNDGCRAAIYVTIPGDGPVDRGFRNKGEAIKYLEHNYGKSWKRLKPNFNHVPTAPMED